MAGSEKTKAQIQTALDAIVSGAGNITWAQIKTLFENYLESNYWGMQATGSYSATAGVEGSISVSPAFSAGSTINVFARGYDSSNNPVAVKVSSVTVSSFSVAVASNCTVEWIAIKQV